MIFVPGVHSLLPGFFVDGYFISVIDLYDKVRCGGGSYFHFEKINACVFLEWRITVHLRSLEQLVMLIPCKFMCSSFSSYLLEGEGGDLIKKM